MVANNHKDSPDKGSHNLNVIIVKDLDEVVVSRNGKIGTTTVAGGPPNLAVVSVDNNKEVPDEKTGPPLTLIDDNTGMTTLE